MTDYSELAKRLREHAENMYVDFLNEAADALEAQARRIAELEAALKPFTAFIEIDGQDNIDVSFSDITVLVTPVTIGDLRAARAALNGERV